MIRLWISLLCRWLAPLESSLRLHMNIIMCFLEINIIWFVQTPECKRTIQILLGNVTALLSHLAFVFPWMPNAARLEFWNITCHLEKHWTVNVNMPSAHPSSERLETDQCGMFYFCVMKKTCHIIDVSSTKGYKYSSSWDPLVVENIIIVFI